MVCGIGNCIDVVTSRLRHLVAGGISPQLAETGLASAIVGRLFSTVQLQDVPSGPGTSATDLLLQVETGPGLPGFGLLSAVLGMLVLAIHRSRHERRSSRPGYAPGAYPNLGVDDVGLMFVPHFVRHILAGPHQFEIYTRYFAGLGLPEPAAQLVMAGTVELATTIGLIFGLWTRLAALVRNTCS